MLIYYLDLFSTVVFAVSGVILARRTGLDIFGALFLGTITAVGGGTTRDLIIGSIPVFWIKDPVYIYISFVTCVVIYILISRFEPPEKSLRIADALGLAVVTIIGTRKAIEFGVDPFIAVAMGVITGVLGGVIRDTLANRLPIVFADPSLYATAALVGGTIFVILKDFQEIALISGVVTTLILRLAAIRWDLKLPTFLRPFSYKMRDDQ